MWDVVSALCADSTEPQARRYTTFSFNPLQIGVKRRTFPEIPKTKKPT